VNTRNNLLKLHS